MGGRVKKVFMQADAPFRMLPQDTDQLYVRNDVGTMVPFSAIAHAHWSSASPRLERYDGEPSVEILGMGKPGTASSGQAMAIMEKLAGRLPRGIGYEWTGLSLQERQASGQTLQLYALSMLVVFLCLAALYESWAIPLSVIMVIPLGMLGTTAAATLAFKMNDVYFQVGLLTTIGLASKNAILIVEFAKDGLAQGKGVIESVIEAAHVRLRPILMTSLAFILGVLPMLLGSGAGRRSAERLGYGSHRGHDLVHGARGDFRPAIFRGGHASVPAQGGLCPLPRLRVRSKHDTCRSNSMNLPRRIAAALVMGTLLGGCSLAPVYHRPALPVPTRYPSDAGADFAASAIPAADIGWREFFGDERLQTLIAMALVNNRDLRVASLTVENARAQYKIQRSELLPLTDRKRERVRFTHACSTWLLWIFLDHA